LEFSKKRWFSKGVAMAVAVEVAAHMKNPTNCPYKSRSSRKRSRRSKKRRRNK